MPSPFVLLPGSSTRNVLQPDPATPTTRLDRLPSRNASRPVVRINPPPRTATPLSPTTQLAFASTSPSAAASPLGEQFADDFHTHDILRLYNSLGEPVCCHGHRHRASCLSGALAACSVAYDSRVAAAQRVVRPLERSLILASGIPTPTRRASLQRRLVAVDRVLADAIVATLSRTLGAAPQMRRAALRDNERAFVRALRGSVVPSPRVALHTPHCDCLLDDTTTSHDHNQHSHNRHNHPHNLNHNQEHQETSSTTMVTSSASPWLLPPNAASHDCLVDNGFRNSPLHHGNLLGHLHTRRRGPFDYDSDLSSTSDMSSNSDNDDDDEYYDNQNSHSLDDDYINENRDDFTNTSNNNQTSMIFDLTVDSVTGTRICEQHNNTSSLPSNNTTQCLDVNSSNHGTSVATSSCAAMVTNVTNNNNDDVVDNGSSSTGYKTKFDDNFYVSVQDSTTESGVPNLYSMDSNGVSYIRRASDVSIASTNYEFQSVVAKVDSMLKTMDLVREKRNVVHPLSDWLIKASSMGTINDMSPDSPLLSSRIDDAVHRRIMLENDCIESASSSLNENNGINSIHACGADAAETTESESIESDSDENDDDDNDDMFRMTYEELHNSVEEPMPNLHIGIIPLVDANRLTKDNYAGPWIFKTPISLLCIERSIRERMDEEALSAFSDRVYRYLSAISSLVAVDGDGSAVVPILLHVDIVSTKVLASMLKVPRNVGH